MPSPYASFDFLFLSEHLSLKLGSVFSGEIHLFAYLGCLLSLFDCQPVAEWGYSFAGLESGAPFSPELQEACNQFEQAGFLGRADESIAITELGKQQLMFLNTLKTFVARKPYLSAACGSLLSFPVGMVRSALSMEPGLRPVLSVGGTRS